MMLYQFFAYNIKTIYGAREQNVLKLSQSRQFRDHVMNSEKYPVLFFRGCCAGELDHCTELFSPPFLLH